MKTKWRFIFWFLILLPASCADDGVSKDTNTETLTGECTKAGSLLRFTITCNLPIENISFDSISWSAVQSKGVKNYEGVDIWFSDQNKILSGSNKTSQKDTIKVYLHLENEKKLVISIP